MAYVYIGLGSNLGDRVGYVQQAVSLIKDIVDVELLNTSSFYETEPVGYQEQDWYINACILIDTSISPEDLLDHCHRIEHQLGRDRDLEAIRWGPRTIDIDILLYDDDIMSSDNLQIPHPRLHERSCALVPLIEINPNIIHPILSKTVQEIYNELAKPDKCFLLGEKEVE